VCDKNASEETFLQTSFTQLQALGIQPKKMMAGLKRKISMPEGAACVDCSPKVKPMQIWG
jgi:hypothetical protein